MAAPKNALLATTVVSVATMAAAAAERSNGDVLIPSVTVVGTAEIQGRPDMAEVDVGVVTEAETAAEAFKQSNRAMERLLDVLDRRDIAKKDIQTTSFNILPRRQQEPSRRREPPKIVGYQVTNQVHYALVLTIAAVPVVLAPSASISRSCES